MLWHDVEIMAGIQNRLADMTYDELAASVETLSYRDKFRLAQLLIQLARKEEEEQNPEKRSTAPATALDTELVEYVAQRLLKLRPSKKPAVMNSIGAMFQFQGGVSNDDKEKILTALIKKKVLTIGEGNRVTYTI